jgi:acetyltransferase-like isoleucine patch superfamily enzyme
MKGQETGGVQQHLSRPGNAVRKYQQTVTGVDSWLILVVYEFIECCVTSVPGRLGRFLRSVFYPFIFASFSRTVQTGKNLTLHQPAKISLAAGVVIEDFVTLSVKEKGTGIILKDSVRVGEKSILSCPGGTIVIGEGTVIESQCRLGSLKGLTIGNSCHIGQRTYLIGAAHAFDRLDIPIIKQPQTCRGETIIGDQVKIGSGVTILDGVRIGNCVHIADGSLVLKDVADSSFVQGVPAVQMSSGVL